MVVDPSAKVHGAAIIEDGAEIGADCDIGPFAVVGPNVKLGNGIKLHSHAVVHGFTKIGDETEIFPFASIGHQPQDLKFAGEKTRLILGKRNTIREHATMNPGTEGGGGVTQVGDGGLFMMGTHVGHDCLIGNDVTLVNNVALGGHCVIGDNVIIGGMAGIHQFTRIGKGAMIGALSMVVSDVIPYGTVMGERASLEGLNLVGLKRAGVKRDQVDGLRHAFKELFESGMSLSDAVAEMRKEGLNNPLIDDVLSFIEAAGKRRLTTPKDS